MSSNYRSILNVQGSSFASTNSFTFDGSSDYVDMGNTLDFTNTDAFSISCWFKRTRSSVTEFLVAKQESSGNARGYTLLIPFDDNKITFVLRNNTAASGRIIADSSSAITDTNWHHVIVTYDGSSAASGITIYLDGLENTGAVQGTLSATTLNSTPFQIAARNGGFKFSGNIDEVAVFNYELSEPDVTTIYNSRVPNNLNELSVPPLSWWRMGEEATYTGRNWDLIDQGSGGNNGFSDTLPPSALSTDVPT